jgi:hypothetical protein
MLLVAMLMVALLGVIFYCYSNVVMLGVIVHNVVAQCCISKLRWSEDFFHLSV